MSLTTAVINVTGCPGGPQPDPYLGHKWVQTTDCPTVGGTRITVTGATFGSVPVVTIGGVHTDIVSWNATSIVAQLQAGSGTGLTLSVRKSLVSVTVN